MADWFIIENIEEIDTPALAVYPARVIQNINGVVSMIGNVSRLRPHVKTNKTIEATRLMMEAGIVKFKCATIAEAEMLGMAGAADVLLAYQPQGPKVQRLIALINKYPGTLFSCLVDNTSSAQKLSDVALQTNLILSVYIDVNIGMNRTGIEPNACLNLYKFCTALPGLNLVGLHVYDGHLHQPDFEERTLACNQAYLSVEALTSQILKAGLQKPVIVAGGSPTFPIHAKRKNVECSPGTFIFWDKGYELTCAEQPFVHAALVISRIVSLPNATTICLDLGHKSIASENELNKRVFFLNAPELVFKGHSEEHLLASVPEGHTYKTGEVLYGLPYHICPTVALYERAMIVDNHICNGEWKIIARDRKITI